MYKIGYIGNFETVPQVVEYIINSDIEKLEEEYRLHYRFLCDLNICFHRYFLLDE